MKVLIRRILNKTYVKILSIGALITALLAIYNLMNPFFSNIYTHLFPRHAGMILIPSGDFRIGKLGGSGYERVSRVIHLNAFWIDKYEVNVGDYLKFCKTQNKSIPTDPRFKTMKNYFSDPRWRDYPVVQVTWWDAKEFCECQGKRLPTEAEWERAARHWNAEDHIFAFIDEEGCPLGNYPDKSLKEFYPAILLPKKASKDGFPFTAPVGSFLPNGNKIYDLEGNVSEWVADTYSKFSKNDKITSNQQYENVDKQKAVVRGPSWAKWESIVTKRLGLIKTQRSRFVGFRCAMDASN